MNLNSYLELFLTLYGWQQYESFWNILAESGIVYIPLGWILISSIITSAQHNRGAAAVAAGSRSPVIVTGGIALAVLTFAGAPYVSFSPGQIAYAKPCTENPAVSPGDTHTTYDDSLTDVVQEVRVPAYWRLVMPIAAGINRAAIAGAGCPEDLTIIRVEIDTTQIHDGDLLMEAEDFIAHCYFPARSQYRREKPLLNITMNGDNDWPGSPVFRDTPGYYDVRHAAAPVRGWPVDAGRETDAYYIAQAGNDPAWGIPYCDEWWNNSEIGLRRKLLDQYDPSLIERLFSVVSPRSQEQREDDVIKRLIQTVRVAAPTSNEFGGSTFSDDGFDNFSLVRVVASLGLKKESLSFVPEMEAIKAALPLGKAFLMMGIIMSLPVFLVVSAYRLEALFIATVGYIGLNFLSVFWHIAQLLEEGLIKALWPDPMTWLVRFFNPMEQPTQSTEFKLQVLEFLLPLLYVVLPLLFSIVMAWGGTKAFAAISGVTQGLTSAVAKGGRDASDTGQNMAGSAASKRL